MTGFSCQSPLSLVGSKGDTLWTRKFKTVRKDNGSASWPSVLTVLPTKGCAKTSSVNASISNESASLSKSCRNKCFMPRKSCFWGSKNSKSQFMRPSDSLELDSSESEFEEDESESDESSVLEDGEASRLRGISMDREEFLCRRGFGPVLLRKRRRSDLYCYTS